MRDYEMDEMWAAEVYEAAEKFQAACWAAFEQGLDIKLHVEKIGGCVGLRERPEIYVEVSRLIIIPAERERE